MAIAHYGLSSDRRKSKKRNLTLTETKDEPINSKSAESDRRLRRSPQGRQLIVATNRRRSGLQDN